jgi:hypothetical protein
LKTADWGKPEEFGSSVNTWYRRNGIDLRCMGGVDGIDLQLWLVDDRRWDTLEAEVGKDEPLPLGREATRSMARFDKTSTDFKFGELATFLFTTREGGRGIVQVFPKDPDADRCRLRYRMWSTAEVKPTTPPAVAEPHQARPRGTPLGTVVTTTLERPALGRESLLDLRTGRKFVPPEFTNPNLIGNALFLLQDEQFTRWCRARGIDLLCYRDPVEIEAAPIAKKPITTFQPRFGLLGLDMIEARVLPQSFDDMTVEEAREILGRKPEDKTGRAWMLVANHLTERPDTFAFKTREGSVGLVQIETAGKDAGKLTIRHRLERRD